jgi:hypothetical protein
MAFEECVLKTSSRAIPHLFFAPVFVPLLHGHASISVPLAKAGSSSNFDEGGGSTDDELFLDVDKSDDELPPTNKKVPRGRSLGRGGH